MAMRTVLCSRQGRDYPTEAQYGRFEVAIPTAELEKCNATTHMELNKPYSDGDNKYGTNMFQEMCLIVSTDLDRNSGIYNNLKNSTLVGTNQ